MTGPATPPASPVAQQAGPAARQAAPAAQRTASATTQAGAKTAPAGPATTAAGPATRQAGPAASRTSPVRIVASVLPADFSRLGEECQALEKAGADRIQWDVMDGRFVPNLTFGPDIIAAARAQVAVPFEAHLMTCDPALWCSQAAGAGCELVIVHAEACPHLHRTLTALREAGTRAGVALNPATPLDAVAHVLDLMDLLLVMTVNPGFGGQRYITAMEPKIAAARQLIDGSGYPIELEVDGGIGPATAAGAVAAGANVLVTGSAIFRHPGGLRTAVTELRAAAEQGLR